MLATHNRQQCTVMIICIRASKTLLLAVQNIPCTKRNNIDVLEILSFCDAYLFGYVKTVGAHKCTVQYIASMCTQQSSKKESIIHACNEDPLPKSRKVVWRLTTHASTLPLQSHQISACSTNRRTCIQASNKPDLRGNILHEMQADKK